MPKFAERCPKCGRYFASIRCPKCGYLGGNSDFSNGCPQCGYSSSPKANAAAHVQRTAGRSPHSNAGASILLFILTGLFVLACSLLLYLITK
ncbi:MAG: hypothetical protein LBG72_06045 [Spirochaetaceae bacterium]|nr:hypothetical protein [Spirochaetaceae bacterium]